MSSFLVKVSFLGWEEVRFIEGSSFAKKTVTEWECEEEQGYLHGVTAVITGKARGLRL